jgi:hypothetical protein
MHVVGGINSMVRLGTERHGPKPSSNLDGNVDTFKAHEGIQLLA